MPAVARTPRRTRRARDHGASDRGVCHECSETVSTRSSQPLSEQVEELGGGGLVEAEHTAVANVRIQDDLIINLADTEIAESPGAVDLAGDGNGAVLSAHDVCDLCARVSRLQPVPSVCSAHRCLAGIQDRASHLISPVLGLDHNCACLSGASPPGAVLIAQMMIPTALGASVPVWWSLADPVASLLPVGQSGIARTREA